MWSRNTFRQINFFSAHQASSVIIFFRHDHFRIYCISCLLIRISCTMYIALLQVFHKLIGTIILPSNDSKVGFSMLSESVSFSCSVTVNNKKHQACTLSNNNQSLTLSGILKSIFVHFCFISSICIL